MADVDPLEAKRHTLADLEQALDAATDDAEVTRLTKEVMALEREIAAEQNPVGAAVAGEVVDAEAVDVEIYRPDGADLVVSPGGDDLWIVLDKHDEDLILEGGVTIVVVRQGKGGVRGESVVLEPGASVVVERAAAGGLLFPRAGGAPWNRQKVNDRWRAVCRRLGIVSVRFHDLRHFHASLLVDAGHREIDVAAQLRHRDNGRLVREVYAHPDNAAALRRIGGGS